MDEFSERVPVRMKHEHMQPPPPPPLQHHAMAGYPQPRGYLGLIIIGIIIIMVGGIVLASWGFLDDPDENGEKREDYNDNVRTITTSGNLIQYVGLLILSIGLILGAVKDETLPPNIRLGMVIAMGIIIGFKISYTYIPLYY
jgi:purine-cytosine permease-like protein